MLLLAPKRKFALQVEVDAQAEGTAANIQVQGRAVYDSSTPLYSSLRDDGQVADRRGALIVVEE